MLTLSLSAVRHGLIEWGQSEGRLWAFVFKVLLSVFIVLWLAYRLELPQPTTTTLTVFIVIQRQNGDVLAKSFWRIIGTLIGLTVMVLLIALFNQQRVLFLLALALWLGLCVAGGAHFRDFRRYACVLAGYTAVMIGMPATLHPDEAFMRALWRVVEIVVAILVSGLVSGIILPLTSVSSLQATRYNRFRDFAGFTLEGLQGQLTADRVEQLNARFAAQAVQLENLCNASAFEDPWTRMRRGRFARLNNEFMVLSTRFHALHRLLERLQGDREQPPLMALLQPCLDEVVKVLAPLQDRLLVDVEAARYVPRLQTSKLALREKIRSTRQQLAEVPLSEVRRLDFDTATELLFRFLDDLHNYLQTQASLMITHHEREQWRDSFTPRSNGLASLISGVRSGVLVLVMGFFWLASGWDSGTMAVLAVGVVAGITSATSRPGPAAAQMLLGAAGSGLAGFALYFWVYPYIDSYPMLFCVIAPVIALGTFWMVHPATAWMGAGWLVWFCILALPDNQTAFAPDHYLNDYLASLAGIAAAAVASSLLLPPDRPWLWQALERDLRLRLVYAVNGRLDGLVAGFESSTRDLLNQAYAQAAGHPQVQHQLTGWMFAVLEIGHAIIELRLEQAALPPEPWYAGDAHWRQAIQRLGQQLVQLFLQVDEVRRQQALAALEQAIEAVRATPEPRAQHFESSPLLRVLSYLHFIRTSLLDPHSPLAAPAPA